MNQDACIGSTAAWKRKTGLPSDASRPASNYKAGAWHIAAPPFSTRKAAIAAARRYLGKRVDGMLWRVVKRGSRWVIQEWRATNLEERS